MTPLSPAGVLCLLPLLGLIDCEAQPKNEDIYGGMNQNVTFSTGKPVTSKDILWKKGKNKVIEWEENLYPEPRSFPPFINRTHLDTHTGNLTIFNVTSSDEDEYEVEYGGVKGNTKFTLKVVAPLPRLTLNCTLTDEDIIIWCEFTEPYYTHESLVNYTWQCTEAQCESSTLPRMLRLKKNNLPKKITCVATNPKFEETLLVVPSTCLPAHSRDRWPLGLSMLVPLLLAGYYADVKKIWTTVLGTPSSRSTDNSELNEMSKS
ncbi:lymphocyte function-associated antigen 3 [Talpa occidentalis]|uniref:lymphocyte function-associated antigen 3 n=1 Tax=Talpa occidentalis TaxID=50954 RepID=UPI0023F7E4E2|nr:lymphocyte function-associated antigen 3 [Talpa occidentalis]